MCWIQPWNSEDLPGFRMALPELPQWYATGVALAKQTTCRLIQSIPHLGGRLLFPMPPNSTDLSKCTPIR